MVSIVEPCLDFTFFLLPARLDIGSREIVLGRGGFIGPISTVSTSDSFWSQLDVAAMEVGRVSVDVIIYEIVPRSNCLISLVREWANGKQELNVHRGLLGGLW